jgi:hypothetical protein
MNRLNRHYEIHELAAAVGLGHPRDPVGAIRDFCVEKVRRTAAAAGGISGIEALEQRLCRELNAEMIPVWQDSDLPAISARFAGEGDPVFLCLAGQFDEQTYATLIRRNKPDRHGQARFVAVIDCRGRKAPRRFFSRWHELAHLLTRPPGPEAPLHRSTACQAPTERLMDLIAADIGFYDPLFRPVFQEELVREGRLRFPVIERVRQRFCAEASFQATMSACVTRLEAPLIFLEAGFGFTKAEEDQFDREPVPSRRPKPSLRVLKVIRNDAARRAGFHIPLNMKVPDTSLLHALYFHRGEGGPAVATEAIEDLRSWKHADGSALPARKISLQGRPLKHALLALVQLTN